MEEVVSSASTLQSRFFKSTARLPMAVFCFARNCRGRNFRDLWPDFGRVLLRWRRVARRIIGAESLQAWGMTFGSFPQST